MRWFPTVGLAIDGLSGLAFLLLAAAVLRLAPRRRLSLAFSVFAASFGLFFAFHNLVARDDPWRATLDLVASPFGVVAGGSIGLVAIWSTPLPRGGRLALWLVPAIAAAAFAGLLAWGWFGLLLPAGVAYTAAVTSIQVGFTFALFLLAVRFLAARGPTAPRERAQAALLGGALAVFPGTQAGMALLLGGSSWTAGVPGAVAFLALGALWLWGARVDGRARIVAWITLAAPLAGMLAALAARDAFAALDSGTLGGARLVMVAVVAYGVVRHHVLGIELTLKSSVRSSLVAAPFAIAFFAAAEGLERVLAVSGYWAGLAAAAIVALALRPIRRGAQRLADRMMPGVHDTKEYHLVRKREVYRATVEGALADGAITERERDMLARLQDELGLSGTEAREIERETIGTTARP